MQEFLAGALLDDHAFVTTALRIMASEFQTALSARKVIEAIGHGETARTGIDDVHADLVLGPDEIVAAWA